MTEDWTPTHAHRKGGLYRFIGYGRNTENDEKVAIYEDILGNVWVRPRWMFDDGRFTPVVAVDPVTVPAGSISCGIVEDGAIKRVFVKTIDSRDPPVKLPCDECHLQHGETCDICGAYRAYA